MARRLLISMAILSVAAACQERRAARGGGAGVPVRVEIARYGEFAATLPLIGIVRPAESIPLTVTRGGIVRYAPRFAGGLRTGEAVARGEMIARVEYEQLRFALTQARLTLDSAAADLERAQRSFQLGIASKAELNGAEARAALAREAYRSAQRESVDLTIRAPRDGVLIVKSRVANGVAVAPGTVLAEIAAAGEPVVESSVSSADRDRLRAGMQVRISRPGNAQWSASGMIREVAAALDENGTASVISSMTSPTSAIPPGTGVELLVDLGKRSDVLTVPEEAVFTDAGGEAVFVVQGRSGPFERAIARRAPVETGGRADGRVEIRSGVREGDHVVVAGGESLTDGAPVTEVKEKEGGAR